MTPALFIITILAAADPLPWPTDLNDRLDRLVRENRAFWRVPGSVVAVTDGTNLRYSTAQGFADVAAGRRMDPNDVFPMASCTKAFTTLLAGCLVDEGKMAWDDPVVRHLPWFKTGGNASYRPITLRDAASHRSGYDAHDLLWYQRAESLRARVERLGGLAPEAAPGERFRYQTSVFTTVGLAEEAVAGKSWEQLVGERILKPLELNSTWTDPARVPAKRIPQGYRLDGEARPVPANTYPWNGPDSTASIHANAADICRWLNFHMGDGSWAGKRIISQANLQETHAPQITQELTPEVRVYHPFTKKIAYGLGWVIFDHRGDTVVAHAGAIDGHRVQVTMVPSRKLAIVVLANLEMTRMNLATSLGIVDEVLNHPFRDYNRPYMRQMEMEARLSLEKTSAEARAQAALPAPTGTLTGKFHHPAYGDAVLSENAGVWTLELGPSKATLLQQGPACWVAPGLTFGDAVVSFDGIDALVVGGRVGARFGRK